MPNEYPLWKYLLLAGVLLLSLIYALPNLYPDDYAVQITGATAAIEVNEPLLKQTESILQEVDIPVKRVERNQDANNLLVRFKNAEDQLKAKDLLQNRLGEDFWIALNLAPTTPQWLKQLGAGPIKLGLDLSGGVHFLMEVDMDQVLEQRMEAYIDAIKTTLREEKIRYASVRYLPSQVIRVQLREQVQVARADETISATLHEFVISGAEDEPLALDLALRETKLKEIQDYAVSQNLATLRNRVNELGVAEPLVQRQGVNRIVVELPGVQDTATAKRVLGRTASLEFRLQDYKNQSATLSSSRTPAGSELFPFKNNERPPVLLEKKVIATGDQVIDAQASYDENGQPQVNITLNGQGGAQMHRITREHVGEPMAVLFVEHKSRMVEKDQGLERQAYVEKYVINVATIQSAFGARFRITGLDSSQESSELALLLRAGALAAPMYFVEERTVGPSLGQANIDSGFKSIVLGFALVVIFMLAYYRLFGLFANIALLANLVIIVAIMSVIPGATLTLPGMAGIVLTVGMAVDANVLINTRIREEYRKGLSPHAAINSGYDRAFITILDANLTTLIIGVILFALGNGPVKGFSVTLIIGVLASMFTAVMGTRALVSLTLGRKTLKTLNI